MRRKPDSRQDVGVQERPFPKPRPWSLGREANGFVVDEDTCAACGTPVGAPSPIRQVKTRFGAAGGGGGAMNAGDRVVSCMWRGLLGLWEGLGVPRKRE